VGAPRINAANRQAFRLLLSFFSSVAAKQIVFSSKDKLRELFTN